MPTKLTRCPYTLVPVQELEAPSREHIIADALGGPDGYSVTACRKANNQLGATADAAFIAEPLVEMFRSKVGVKSKSGIASWNLSGHTVDGVRPVDVEFPHEGSVDIYHRKPVEKDAKGHSIKIIAPPEQSEKLRKKIERSLAIKGKKVGSIEKSQSPSQQINLQMTIDMTIMRAGLLKIAYLACCEFLGDAFLDDPLNPEWQKAIRAQTAEDSENIKINGRCFNEAIHGANMLLPKLEENEHGIAIVNVNQSGPVVVVRLFGCYLLTAFALTSETNDYDLPKGDGLLLICDSKSKTIRREPWSSYLLRMSGITRPHN